MSVLIEGNFTEMFQDMVVLPYKDSLLLFSRYLQQLVMESLGKEFDLDGNRVMQLFILTVFHIMALDSLAWNQSTLLFDVLSGESRADCVWE